MILKVCLWPSPQWRRWGAGEGGREGGLEWWVEGPDCLRDCVPHRYCWRSPHWSQSESGEAERAVYQCQGWTVAINESIYTQLSSYQHRTALLTHVVM